MINPYNNCILRKIIFFQYLPTSIGLVDQMGARFDRLRCEVFQNLFLNPMNTGFVRPAVATVLTACGIETYNEPTLTRSLYIPVATVLTACGIETTGLAANAAFSIVELQQYLPLAVLKLKNDAVQGFTSLHVATVLTACGIETA